MKKVLIWSRRFLVALMLLLAVAWILGEASQWILRWQAARLLADVQSFNVSRSTTAEVQAFQRRWSRWGATASSCYGNTCYTKVFIKHLLPTMFRGDPNEESKSWLLTTMDHIGLRSAQVGGGFNLEHGVVTQKWFSEEVSLPVREWFVSGGAYVPTIASTSIEAAGFNETDLQRVNPSHSSRIAHDIKSGFGLIVKFKPDETIPEQAALMDFHFSCITKFFPCRSERDILPEGWQLLQEKY